MHLPGRAERELVVESTSEPSDVRAPDSSAELQLALLQTALDSVEDGILVIDLEGRIIKWNQQLIAMWEIPEHIVSSGDVKKAYAFFRDRISDPKRFEERVAQLIAEPEREHFDTLELKDGRVFERFSRPQWMDGRLVGRVVSFHDISSLERAVRSLQQREEQLAEAQRLAQIGSWEIDIRAGTAVWSQELFRIFGRTPEEFTPTLANFIEFVHPEDKGWVTELLISSSAGQPFDSTYRIIRPDGSVRVLHANGRVVAEDGGSILLRGFAQDITEKQELEVEIRQSQKMEAIGRLAGGVAHDLNNVLTAIFGYCEILREEAASDQAKEAVDEIEVAATSGAALMGQLLDLSRGRPAKLQVFNIDDLLDPLRSLLKSVAREDLDLRFHLDAEEPFVRMQETQFEQILLNLVINARDALPGGGEVVVATSNVKVKGSETFASDINPGAYILLTVSDNGSGMDRQTRDRAFEPFFTTKQQGEVHGTGLGLSIVYGIARQLGGMVRLDSQLGIGTEVSVYLPQTAEQPASERPEESPSKSYTGNEKILVVEDDRRVREVVIRALEQQGYRLLTASRPQEALALLESDASTIDLLVTDVVMPDMNGPELATIIRDRYPGVGVIYMSGYPQQLLEKEDLAATGSVFIQKPVRLSALVEQVRKVLDKRNDSPAGALDG